jgi:hypothetical protein
MSNSYTETPELFMNLALTKSPERLRQSLEQADFIDKTGLELLAFCCILFIRISVLSYRFFSLIL